MAGQPVVALAGGLDLGPKWVPAEAGEQDFGDAHGPLQIISVDQTCLPGLQAQQGVERRSVGGTAFASKRAVLSSRMLLFII